VGRVIGIEEWLRERLPGLAGENGVPGVAVAVALLLTGTAPAGALLFGAAMAGVGMTGAALGAAAGQLLTERRAASGLATALLLDHFFGLSAFQVVVFVFLPMPIFSFLLARHAKALYLAMDHYFDPHLKHGASDKQ